MPLKLNTKNPAGPPVPVVASRDFDLSAAGEAGGKKKALLVGINYVEQDWPGLELSGCINDANNLKRVLMQNYGFKEENIMILTEHETPDRWPTSAIIKGGVNWLVDGLEKGDTIFFHYSGHGSQVASAAGSTEADGQDEVLVPLDAYKNGGYEYYDLVIKDDWLTEKFHDQIPDGVKCICNFDCCHSGTMADLSEIRDVEAGETVNLSIVMKGIKLAAKDSFLLGGKSDPFIRIESSLQKDADGKNKVLVDEENNYIKQNLNPEFKPFKLKANKEDILKITVLDHDFNGADIIGIAKLEVSDIATGKEIQLNDYKERPEAELAKYRKDNPDWPGKLVIDAVVELEADPEPPKSRTCMAPGQYVPKNTTRYGQMVHYHLDGTRTVETVKIWIDENGRQHYEKVPNNDGGMQGWFQNQASRWGYGGGQSQQAAPAPAPAPEAAPTPGPATGTPHPDTKTVWTISGCQDHQTSADATISGQPQGAMSWALIKTLKESNGNITYNELLHRMRAAIKAKGPGYDQVPSISTTHPHNYDVKFMG